MHLALPIHDFRCVNKVSTLELFTPNVVHARFPVAPDANADVNVVGTNEVLPPGWISWRRPAVKRSFHGFALIVHEAYLVKVCRLHRPRCDVRPVRRQRVRGSHFYLAAVDDLLHFMRGHAADHCWRKRDAPQNKKERKDGSQADYQYDV